MKKGTFKYHILLVVFILVSGWISDYIYKGYDGFLENFDTPFSILSVFNLCFFTIYWINYRYICPRYLDQKPRYKFIFAVIAQLFLFAGLRYLIEEVIVYHITGQHNYVERTRKFYYYVFDNSLYAIKAILYSTVFYLLENYIITKDKIHQLEYDRKSAELNLLKSQLEPHFLFNTLNTFYTELIESQPETAKDIHRLSELLRYVTYETKSDLMPLESELKFIDDYIYFYKKRFEDQLHIDYELTGNPKDKSIPALLLIHFFENIFKHAVLNNKERPAQINIAISDKFLTLKSENAISDAENYTEKGIGSINLKRRLNNLYGNEYSFYAKKESDMYNTYLKIPLNI